MDELKVEVALEIIELKILHLIKNNKDKNFSVFKEKLNALTEEREKIYNLDEKTIDKVYNLYLQEIKNNKENKNGKI